MGPPRCPRATAAGLGAGAAKKQGRVCYPPMTRHRQPRRSDRFGRASARHVRTRRADANSLSCLYSLATCWVWKRLHRLAFVSGILFTFFFLGWEKCSVWGIIRIFFTFFQALSASSPSPCCRWWVDVMKSNQSWMIQPILASLGCRWFTVD